MAGETNVGSVVGFLRLDTTDWSRALAGAQAQVEALGSADPNVDIRTNATEAMGRLAAVQAEADHLGGEHPTIHPDVDTDPVERGMARAQKSTLGLMDAVLLLGPATIPAGAAAGALGASFAGMGAAGVLAVLGIKNEMAAGTAEGLRFKGALDTLKRNLDALAVTAAAGVMAPFLGVVSDLQPKMPAINNGISALAGELGQVMRPAADGISTAFVKLLPLMTDVSSYAVKAANSFDQWAQSDGLQKFGGYAMSMLPQVTDTIGELAQLAVHAAQAFAPFGGTVLSSLQLLSGVINSLPTPVLQTLATTGTSVYLAFKSYGLIVRLVSSLGSALGGLSANLGRIGASGAASRIQGVASALQNVETAGSRGNIAVAGAASVLGIATIAWTLYKQKQQEAKQAQDEMTQAIQADNGALGDQAGKLIAQKLAAGDTVAVLNSYGISLKEIMAAVANDPGAWDRLNAKLADNATQSQAAAGAAGGLGKEVRGLAPDAASALDVLKQYHDEVTTGKGKVAQETAYQKAFAAATGEVTTKLTDAQVAQLGMATETSNSTAKVKAQNKAIQDLNTQLDAEISKQLQLQGGLTGIGAARLSLIQDLKKQTSSTNANTSAGVANRQSIEQVVGQLQSYRDTQIKNGVSTANATAKYVTQAAAILDTIRRLDGAKSSTYAYARQLLAIPKSVSTQVHVTAPGAATALATIQAILRAAGNANASIDNLGRHGRKLPGYASGTDSAPGGLAMVGEAGAELVLGPQVKYLAAGTRVLNHQQTMQVVGPNPGRSPVSAPAPAQQQPVVIHNLELHADQVTDAATLLQMVQQLPMLVRMQRGV